MKNTMRHRSFIVGLIALLASVNTHLQASEANIFAIHELAVAQSNTIAPVSFSIEYPTGWRCQKFDPPKEGTPVNEPVCEFHPTNHLLPVVSFTIWRTWRSDGSTAKAAAETFTQDVRRLGRYKERKITEVKTKAGDGGYLVECEATFQSGPVISHDYFFHVGTKGAIRILIVTSADGMSLRSELDKLVLQTLHFNER